MKPANLKALSYSDTEQDAVKSLCDRLSGLYDADIEDTAKAILATLGKMRATLVDGVGAGVIELS